MTRADELTRLLYLSAETSDGNPDRSHITNLDHNLRVASLARRHCSRGDRKDNPRNKFIIFMALVHDIARPLSDIYHGEVIAEVVRDMVDEDIYNVLRTHGEYQSRLIHGFKGIPTFKDDPWNYLAEKLCAWEAFSFTKTWPTNIPMMTLDEAVEVIKDVCGDRY